jgi:hypothetical protein
MYYEICVNGVSLGVFGHPGVKNMHLSVMVTPDGPEVFASAVCSEDGANYFYDWLQHRVASDDVVTFRQVAGGQVPIPRMKRKMSSESSSGATPGA